MDITIPFTAPISQEIWEKKYRYQYETPFETWARIAEALSSVEETPELQKKWKAKFYSSLEKFKFLPAGRIISGAGTGRRVTLSNCFTMGTIPDSLDGIFDNLKEAALTMQQGGGIGYDFSTIRPKGAKVLKVDSDASGPLSFMDVWDSMCRTIISAGSRRGAMMATMRCDHPDVFDFINAKSDPGRLRMFNMSVLITDDFMKAVEENDSWDLVFAKEPSSSLKNNSPVPSNANKHSQRANGKYIYRTVRARDLWDEIMRSTYAQAEPGVIFIDRINEDHNLNYLETIATTNPCGEKPMGPYASCLLGSINLTQFIKNPFYVSVSFDETVLKRTVKNAIRMMDNVIETGMFPLGKQLIKAKKDRQLGLGVTGLADALAMMGVRYGSKEAAMLAGNWMKMINHAAYNASIDLAKEKGAFQTFEADGFLAEGTHASRLPDNMKKRIRKYGIRNSLVTSIAPTGTISLYAGNVSSGIEPIFAPAYTRKILEKNGTHTEQLVEDYAVTLYREFCEDNDVEFDIENLPIFFPTTNDLSPSEHIVMQAALQQNVDSSISKTVNLPEDISFEDFKGVYWLAYESGCKGCTTYRPNDITGSILTVDTKDKDEPVEQTREEYLDENLYCKDEQDLSETIVPRTMETPMDRPEALPGLTHKIKWPDSEHAIYVTISDIFENGKRRPFEIFINSKNMEHFSWTVALTRMISAVFRRGGDVTFVVEELKAVFDPRGGAWMGGKYIPSMLAAIGGIIENHMEVTGYIERGTDPEAKPMNIGVDLASGPDVTVVSSFKLCPKCSSTNYIKEAGCETCKDCGHSACG